MSRLAHLVSIVPPEHMPMARMVAGTAKERYRMHKLNAKNRGIEFRLTFEEWSDWWMATGHYHEYGRKRGQYVMARKGDKGAYELGNVECLQAQENSTAPHVGAKRSAETVQRMKQGIALGNMLRSLDKSLCKEGK